MSYIGVDINVGDVYLLSRVNGLNKARAKAIIEYRSVKSIIVYAINKLTVKREKGRYFRPERFVRN